jgi:hypothetical protein
MEERSVAVEVAASDTDVGGPAGDLDEKLGTLRDEVADRGGVPLQSSDRRRYGARFCVVAPDPAAAVHEGVEAFRQAATTAGLPGSPIVDVEAPTLEELEDRNPADVPELVDIVQVAELLGVDHRLVTIIVRTKGFPAPAAELHAGPVWTRRSVVDFLRRQEPDCDQCGFVHANVAPAAVPSALLHRAGQYAVVLAGDGDGLRARPSPGVWSALEYACHVRDVLEVQRRRLHLAVSTDRPRFEPMGREERVDRDHYNEQDPSDVAVALVGAATRLAADLEALDDEGWRRTGVYNWPEVAERTQEWMARQTLHELEHHLRDMERVVAAARRPSRD